MFLSVVIPTYNRKPILEKCLLALEQQEMSSHISGYEVVVVDDGSIDDTFEIATAFGPHMNGVRLQVFQSKSNKGAGAARNFAIEKSSGSILAFLDADDEWLPKKLE